jgi:beta-phosphoglucomutase family hydrolase
MAPPVTVNGELDWSAYDAVLFDLDGVLTPTAELHQQAWTTMFEQFLDEHLGPDHVPYTEADYLAYVDGKPRYDGVRSFLEARGIHLPEGNRDEPPGTGSIAALGNRKDAIFQELLRTAGIEPYPGSVRLLDHLNVASVPAAVVSSSRNARDVLTAARLGDRFTVVADGILAAERSLPGKPAPDLFFAAAEKLGATPAAAVVVEDALAGVAAGRAGGFGLVIGVDRGAGRDALMANGADIVVDDLGELAP